MAIPSLSERNPQTIINDEGPITRGQFGSGKLGETVFGYIIEGSKCERRFVDNGNVSYCGKPAKGSVDFDCHSHGDIVLVCGEECAKATEDVIKEDAQREGFYTRIERNGWNRSANN
ncbi:MAG: hypothetical protein Q8P10_00030 [bacterium]|nr:hypothetical protein [bacterium]